VNAEEKENYKSQTFVTFIYVNMSLADPS